MPSPAGLAPVIELGEIQRQVVPGQRLAAASGAVISRTGPWPIA